MSIRYALFFMLAFLASACASDHSFKTEHEFAAHINQLGLSNLTVPAAISRLTAEGFTCYPQKDSVACVREIKGLVCNQKQIVGLPSPSTNHVPLKVSSQLGQVCL